MAKTLLGATVTRRRIWDTAVTRGGGEVAKTLMMIAIERARREKLAGGCVTTVVLVDGKKIDLEKLISNHGTEMLNRENLAVEGWPSVTRGKRQKICPESVTRKNPVDGGGLESLFVPLDMKKKLELESQMQKHREEQIAQGGCLLEWPLNPYCTCDPSSSCHEDKSPIFSLPYGALEEHCPDFEPIWLTYFCQIRQTHVCFLSLLLQLFFLFSLSL